ncbi:hypothetical protein K445DRAFT_265352 [Daldinia sp. EC12]|nr:hypothetical protein K445DRAFT_265352 [Daldinia sp. EC12]
MCYALRTFNVFTEALNMGMLLALYYLFLRCVASIAGVASVGGVERGILKKKKIKKLKGLTGQKRKIRWDVLAGKMYKSYKELRKISKIIQVPR